MSLFKARDWWSTVEYIHIQCTCNSYYTPDRSLPQIHEVIFNKILILCTRLLEFVALITLIASFIVSAMACIFYFKYVTGNTLSVGYI